VTEIRRSRRGRLSVSVRVMVISGVHYQYFTKIEGFPENRGAGFF